MRASQAGAKVDLRDRPGALFRAIRGLMAMMTHTKKYSNLSIMVNLVGYGRSPLHHAAYKANVGMLRALHDAGAPVGQVPPQRPRSRVLSHHRR